LARIQSEIVTFGRPGASSADEVLAKIASILAAAGYDVPDALVERFQVLWSDPSQGPG
jgi:hypothetical protein